MDLISKNPDDAMAGKSPLTGLAIVPSRPLVALEGNAVVGASEQPGTFPVKIFICHISAVFTLTKPIGQDNVSAMMWDGETTQGEIASAAIDALFHRIVVDPPRGWISKPWFKSRYPYRHTVSGRTHGLAFPRIGFEHFRPQHKWWVTRGYSTLHFHFRTEDDALLFRMAVI